VAVAKSSRGAVIRTDKTGELMISPWNLVWGQPYIDSNRLASAIEAELSHNANPDFRTRLLIRDAAQALQSFFGTDFIEWLNLSSEKAKIESILQENFEQVGFHNIQARLVTNIKRNELEQVLELLGRKILQPVEVCIAGSIPALMSDLTARPTDHIDFIDEVPLAIREQRSTLELISEKYGLTIAHVQSHYLPRNWRTRCHHFGDYGNLKVFVAHEYDIFVSKLSSKLEKHRDDLRVMSNKLDKEKIKQLLITDGKAFLDSEFERPTIESNWLFIYREPLFRSQ
jgi:hypothetical protein